MNDLFGDGFDDLFRGAPKSSGYGDRDRAKSATKKPEKGLPWRAKTIDGKLYLPLEQVIELLKQNDVLPAVRKGLERHL